VECISDKMYAILRRHLYDITVLNLHAPTEDKSDNIKDTFYEELEHILDQFPKYHMKILGEPRSMDGKDDKCIQKCCLEM